jgi:hypothetical protein
VLRIRRPHDYNPTAAKALGPAEPSPYINLALLSVLGGLVDEASAPRISVSGLPTALEEEQVGGGLLLLLLCVCCLLFTPCNCFCCSAFGVDAMRQRGRLGCIHCVTCYMLFLTHQYPGLRFCAYCCLQVRSILSTFGALKAFTMLRDAAGKPTGTVLAEFADPGVINAAVAGACAWAANSTAADCSCLGCWFCFQHAVG